MLGSGDLNGFLPKKNGALHGVELCCLGNVYEAGSEFPEGTL